MENTNQNVYRELDENVKSFEESSSKSYGKIVGFVGILFNIFVLIILFTYGATIWGVIFSVSFWIFAASCVLSVVWIFAIVFNIFWCMVMTLVFYIIQFCYCIYLAVVYVLAIIAGGVGIGDGALLIFIFVLGLSATGLSGVYFYYAVKSFVKISFTKKETRMKVSYTVASAQHPGQTDHYTFEEIAETI